VLVCASRASNTQPLIETARCFAVNILADDQVELSNRFASKKDEWRRFDGLDCTSGATGAPYIPGAVATLDCRVRESVAIGDHVIYFGEVEQVVSRDKSPLVYCQRSYYGLGDLSP
jgi:flavin reductase (DIM6/NTAB) family NADH-FMN oxidoreductase RutF